MSTIPLRVKKLSELATIPLRGSPGAAGLDLSSAHDTVIPARGKGIVKTDLAFAIPGDCYGGFTGGGGACIPMEKVGLVASAERRKVRAGDVLLTAHITCAPSLEQLLTPSSVFCSRAPDVYPLFVPPACATSFAHVVLVVRVVFVVQAASPPAAASHGRNTLTSGPASSTATTVATWASSSSTTARKT